MKPTGISERKTIAGSSSSNRASRLRRRMDSWEKPWVTLASLPRAIGHYTDLQVGSPRICHPLCLIRREIRRSIQVGRSRCG